MNSTADANVIDLKWFGKLTPKQLLGAFAALLVALLLTLFGLGVSCFCFGMLIIAVILVMLPRMLGVDNIKLMTLIGVLFLVATVLIGGFLIPPGGQGNPDVKDHGFFADVRYDYNTDGVINITTTLHDDIDMTSREVCLEYGMIHGFDFIIGSGLDQTYILDTAGTLSSGSVSLDPNILYGGRLVIKDISDPENISNVENSNTASTLFKGAFTGNMVSISIQFWFLQTIIILVIFFAILLFSQYMRTKMEKTREKMEQDGRLYPQGHGRCVKCGAVVLPGEITCRKCGEYIDRPDEMKPDKMDFFECSDCGAEVPADAKHCPKCGAAFDEEEEIIESSRPAEPKVEPVAPAPKKDAYGRESIVCPECGEVSPAGAWFCPRCGRSFDEKK